MTLLADINAFLDDSGMPPSNFGTAALRDPGFVAGLRKGREVRRRTEQRARDYMAAHVRGEPVVLPPKREPKRVAGIPLTKARRKQIVDRDRAFRAKIESRYGMPFEEYRRLADEGLEPASVVEQRTDFAGQEGERLLVSAATACPGNVGRILQAALDGRDIELLDSLGIEHAADHGPDRHSSGVVHLSVPVAVPPATVAEGGAGSNPGPAGGAA